MSCDFPKTVTVYRDLIGWDDDGTLMHAEWNVSPLTSLLDVAGARPSEQVGKYVFIATFPPPSFELKA